MSNPTTSSTKSDERKYTIEKISDIFQIPKDSFADFLVDLESFYDVGRNMTNLIHGASKVIGVNVEALPQKMVWTDDKRHDAAITILTNNNNGGKDE